MAKPIQQDIVIKGYDQASAPLNKVNDVLKQVKDGTLDVSAATAVLNAEQTKQSGTTDKLTGYIREQRLEQRQQRFVMNELKDVIALTGFAMVALNKGSADATAEQKKLSNAVTNGAMAFFGLDAAISSISAALGIAAGPIGIAVAAVGALAAAYMALTDNTEDAKKKHEEYMSTLRGATTEELKLEKQKLEAKLKSIEEQKAAAISASAFNSSSTIMFNVGGAGDLEEQANAQRKAIEAIDKILSTSAATNFEILKVMQDNKIALMGDTEAQLTKIRDDAEADRQKISGNLRSKEKQDLEADYTLKQQHVERMERLLERMKSKQGPGIFPKTFDPTRAFTKVESYAAADSDARALPEELSRFSPSGPLSGPDAFIDKSAFDEATTKYMAAQVAERDVLLKKYTANLNEAAAANADINAKEVKATKDVTDKKKEISDTEQQRKVAEKTKILNDTNAFNQQVSSISKQASDIQAAIEMAAFERKEKDELARLQKIKAIKLAQLNAQYERSTTEASVALAVKNLPDKEKAGGAEEYKLAQKKLLNAQIQQLEQETANKEIDINEKRVKRVVDIDKQASSVILDNYIQRQMMAANSEMEKIEIAKRGALDRLMIETDEKLGSAVTADEELAIWAEFEAKRTVITQDAAEKRAALEAASAKKAESERLQITQQALGFLNKGVALYAKGQKQASDANISRLESEKETALGSIEDRMRAMENANQSDTAGYRALVAQKEAVNNEFSAKIRTEKERQWKAERDASAVEAAINTAVEVTQVLATPWMIPIIAAMGAAQVALIMSQPMPRFAQGGQFTVPTGYENDSFPMLVSSGERVTVETPGQQKQSAGSTMVFNFNGNSWNEESVIQAISNRMKRMGVTDVNRVIRNPKGNLALGY
jgi:hypothetical protein